MNWGDYLGSRSPTYQNHLFRSFPVTVSNESLYKSWPRMSMVHGELRRVRLQQGERNIGNVETVYIYHVETATRSLVSAALAEQGCFRRDVAMRGCGARGG